MADWQSVRWRGNLYDGLMNCGVIATFVANFWHVKAILWGAHWKNTRVVTPKTAATESPDKEHECDWKTVSFDELKKLVAEQVPEGDRRRKATELIEAFLDPNKALQGEKEMATDWASRADTSPSWDVHEKQLAELWSITGCAAVGAPYVYADYLPPYVG